jgi:hypothetical protein
MQLFISVPRLRMAGLAVLLVLGWGVAPASAEESYGDLLSKGARFVKARNLPRALEAFGDAVRADPTGIDAYFNAGSVAERLKKCPETMMFFRGFLFLSPGTDDDRQAKAAVTACESKTGTGTLTLRSEPKGVEVALDRILQARTPVTKSKFPVGTYRMTVSCACPDFEDFAREVVITEGKDTEVDVALVRKLTFGFLQIETEPKDGVKVFLDDQSLGETPVEKQRLESRKHSVRLEKQGYEPWVRNVIVERDKVKIVQAALEPSVAPVDTGRQRPKGQE